MHGSLNINLEKQKGSYSLALSLREPSPIPIEPTKNKFQLLIFRSIPIIFFPSYNTPIKVYGLFV